MRLRSSSCSPSFPLRRLHIATLLLLSAVLLQTFCHAAGPLTALPAHGPRSPHRNKARGQAYHSHETIASALPADDGVSGHDENPQVQAAEDPSMQARCLGASNMNPNCGESECCGRDETPSSPSSDLQARQRFLYIRHVFTVVDPRSRALRRFSMRTRIDTRFDLNNFIDAAAQASLNYFLMQVGVEAQNLIDHGVFYHSFRAAHYGHGWQYVRSAPSDAEYPLSLVRDFLLSFISSWTYQSAATFVCSIFDVTGVHAEGRPDLQNGPMALQPEEGAYLGYMQVSRDPNLGSELGRAGTSGSATLVGPVVNLTVDPIPAIDHSRAQSSSSAAPQATVPPTRAAAQRPATAVSSSPGIPVLTEDDFDVVFPDANVLLSSSATEPSPTPDSGEIPADFMSLIDLAALQPRPRTWPPLFYSSHDEL